MVADFRSIMSQSHGVPVSQVLAELYGPLVPGTGLKEESPQQPEPRDEVQEAPEQHEQGEQESAREHPPRPPDDDGMGRQRWG